MGTAKEIIDRLESYANYGQIRCSIDIRHCYLSNQDYSSDIDMFEKQSENNIFMNKQKSNSNMNHHTVKTRTLGKYCICFFGIM